MDMDGEMWQIVLLGSGAIGAKTRLVHRYCLDEYVEEYCPTIFDNYR